MIFTIKNFIKAIKRPKEFLEVLAALIKGSWYIIYYRLINNRIRIAFPFYSYAPVYISGPGTVILGKSCRSLWNAFKGLTIVTESDRSIVTIGDNCLLGGVTIRCSDNILIGNNVMTAFSLIQDNCYSSFDDPHYKYHDHSRFKEVIIGNNVWIGGQCIVLGGCTIGNDCVLSFGTCCHNMEVADYSLIIGNPAKRPLPIDKVLQLVRAA